MSTLPKTEINVILSGNCYARFEIKRTTLTYNNLISIKDVGCFSFENTIGNYCKYWTTIGEKCGYSTAIGEKCGYSTTIGEIVDYQVLLKPNSY